MDLLLFLLQTENLAITGTNSSIVTIIIAIIGLFGGGTILKLYQLWIKNKNASTVALRDQLTSRVTELEDEVKLLRVEIKALMEKASKEVLELATKNSRLEMENIYLQKEVERLQEK